MVYFAICMLRGYRCYPCLKVCQVHKHPHNRITKPHYSVSAFVVQKHKQMFQAVHHFCLIFLSGCCRGGEPVYQIKWASCREFSQILVGPRMVADHLPGKLQRALDQLMDNMPEIGGTGHEITNPVA